MMMNILKLLKHLRNFNKLPLLMVCRRSVLKGLAGWDST